MGIDRDTPPEDATGPRDLPSLWIRRGCTALLIGALVSPVIRDQDSLPLSTYPMYSSARSNVSSFVTASGVDESGDRTTLSALTISQSRDRLIAQAFLNDAVQRGEAVDACVGIAGRVGDASTSGGAVTMVEIAVERHDTVERLRGEDSLQQRDVIVSCEVPK